MGSGSGLTLVVGIPAYNEEREIGRVVSRSLEYGSSVVVIDDGSTDETAAAAIGAGAFVVRHQTNCGKGAAVATLFDYFLRHHADVLVMIDGDGQHDPNEIPYVAAPCLAGTADMVVGSRFLSAAKCEIPRVRRFGQVLFNGMTALASGVPCSDSQSGFRAFSRHAICAMRLSESSFSVECEMQFEARARRLRIEEVPITCSYALPAKRSLLAHGYDVFSRLGTMTIERRILGTAPVRDRELVSHSIIRADEFYEAPVLASGD